MRIRFRFAGTVGEKCRSYCPITAENSPRTSDNVFGDGGVPRRVMRFASVLNAL